jgi:hypothetical protein
MYFCSVFVKIWFFKILYFDVLSGYVIMLPLVNKGICDTLTIIPLSIALEQGNLIYMNTDKSIFCFDRATQYKFLFDESELEVCKAVNKGSHCASKDIHFMCC